MIREDRRRVVEFDGAGIIVLGAILVVVVLALLAWRGVA